MCSAAAHITINSLGICSKCEKECKRVEWLNVIGQDSKFHEEFGYYADPVDETTAILPKDWKSRLVNLPAGDTGGVAGLCLDPHDLAIAKYAAGREKDAVFTRELAPQRNRVE